MRRMYPALLLLISWPVLGQSRNDIALDVPDQVVTGTSGYAVQSVQVDRGTNLHLAGTDHDADPTTPDLCPNGRVRMRMLSSDGFDRGVDWIDLVNSDGTCDSAATTLIDAAVVRDFSGTIDLYQFFADQAKRAGLLPSGTVRASVEVRIFRSRG